MRTCTWTMIEKKQKRLKNGYRHSSLSQSIFGPFHNGPIVTLHVAIATRIAKRCIFVSLFWGLYKLYMETSINPILPGLLHSLQPLSNSKREVYNKPRGGTMVAKILDFRHFENLKKISNFTLFLRETSWISTWHNNRNFKNSLFNSKALFMF